MLFSRKLSAVVIFAVCLLVSGCADNPGTWPQDKVATLVKDSLVKDGLEVTEISLSPKDGGGFEGTGSVAGGETVKLVVTQDAAARRISWDAEGDRGSYFSGSYELK
jgi:hypothetical protein